MEMASPLACHRDHLVSLFVFHTSQEIVQERYAISTTESEPRRVRSEALCNNSGMVVDPIDDFDRDLGNAVRIDVVSEEIADHPTSSCRR